MDLQLSYAIVVVSDTCSQDKTLDKTGVCLVEKVSASFPNASIEESLIIPDEVDEIRSTLLRLCAKNIDLVVTAGGTGVAKRDVTPEATRTVLDREIPGISQAMLVKSLPITDMAMISRAVAGIRGSTLIINLPGSVKGSSECFDFVKSVIPHTIQLIRNDKEEIVKQHEKMQTRSDAGGDQSPKASKSKVRTDQVASRERESPYQMVSMNEANNLITEVCKAIKDTEVIRIEDSLDRVLAEDVQSEQPHPPFRSSQKDGYAVLHQDGARDRTVVTYVGAGDEGNRVSMKTGDAVRISTGAMVPEGATAVVQVEDTELVEVDETGEEKKIRIKVTPAEGLDIREIGSDIKAGEVVFKKGDVLSPAHIGVLASFGKMTIKVYRQASIGIISTGKELCPYNTKVVSAGHIRDSNKLTLINLLRKYGFEAADLGIITDHPDDLNAAFEKAFTDHDVVITSGGVSMGEFDYVKDVLKQDFNAQIHFGRINMKPGKPTTFASCLYNNKMKYVFGLPGNPVSATVTCFLFVVPAVHFLQSRQFNFLECSANFNEEIKLDPRPEYMRVTLSKNGKKIVAHRTGNQVSSKLNSCAGAHALAVLPGKSDTKTKITIGEDIQIILLEPYVVGL